MKLLQSMFRFHTRAPGLLKAFGIDNPNIYRNLR